MRLRVLALIFALLAALAASAQTTTGAVFPWNCGRMSTPTYCYGIPVTVSAGGVLESGQLWLDQQSSGSGFIYFLNGFLGLGQASITSPFAPLSTKGGTVQYGFAGTDINGTAFYSGTLTLTYTAYYSSGGGGRGGGGAGWRWVVTGGTISIQ